jgi:hypothetical protein
MRALRISMIVASLVTIVSGCATGHDKPLAVEGGNYCQDEAIQWVKDRFGEDTQIRASWIDKAGIQEKAVTGWRVLVWTNKCDGYFTMDYGFRTVSECTRPQHGERHHMMLMVGAVGDCRRLLPRMEHPRK